MADEALEDIIGKLNQDPEPDQLVPSIVFSKHNDIASFVPPDPTAKPVDKKSNASLLEIVKKGDAKGVLEAVRAILNTNELSLEAPNTGALCYDEHT